MEPLNWYKRYKFLKQPITRVAILLCTLFATDSWTHPGSGIVVNRRGEVYFVLSGGPYNRIMKFDGQGQLAPFVIDERLRAPHHLVIDPDGNLYTSSDNDGIVWKITPDGRMMQIYPTENEKWNVFVGAWGDPFTIDPAGNIYVLDNDRIWKISPDGKVTRLE